MTRLILDLPQTHRRLDDLVEFEQALEHLSARDRAVLLMITQRIAAIAADEGESAACNAADKVHKALFDPGPDGELV